MNHSILPSAFISHGAPDRVLGESAAKQFLLDFSQFIDKPSGILVISAHWMTGDLCMSSSGSLSAMYDFFGFPQQLYRIRYDAHQDEWLERKVQDLLHAQGQTIETVDRQLDHGCWSVLKLAYPEADIPVSMLSLPRYDDFDDYLRLGAMLKPLRKDNILIIGSGSATHNLGQLNLQGHKTQWADEFVQWLQSTVKNNDYQAMCHLYDCAPFAAMAHPSAEHYLPLLIAAGAAQEETSQLIHDSYELGSLNNSSFLFGNTTQTIARSL